MARKVREAGAEFFLLLLPTKERVFADRVADKNAYIQLAFLVANENKQRRELIDYLKTLGIAYWSPLESLVRARVQPYFSGADGYPKPFGHQIIAHGLTERLELNEHVCASRR